MTPEEEKKRFYDAYNQTKTERDKFRARVRYLESDEGIAEISEKLRISLLEKCPMCGYDVREYVGMSHVVIGAYPSPGGFLGISVPSIPTVTVCCGRCGVVTQHSALVLGLIEAPKPIEELSQHGKSLLNVLFDKDK